MYSKTIALAWCGAWAAAWPLRVETTHLCKRPRRLPPKAFLGESDHRGREGLSSQAAAEDRVQLTSARTQGGAPDDSSPRGHTFPATLVAGSFASPWPPWPHIPVQLRRGLPEQQQLEPGTAADKRACTVLPTRADVSVPGAGRAQSSELPAAAKGLADVTRDPAELKTRQETSIPSGTASPLRRKERGG